MGKLIRIGLTLVVLLTCSAAYSKDVAGEVVGVWERGETINVLESIWIPEGESLEIQADAVILVSPDVRFDVYGYLDVKGEPGSPVIFRCSEDDAEWQGITITDPSSNYGEMRYAEIINVENGIVFREANFYLNSVFIEASRRAVSIENNSDVEIQSCHFVVSARDIFLKAVLVMESNINMDNSRVSVTLDNPTADRESYAIYLHPRVRGSITNSYIRAISDGCIIGVKLMDPIDFEMEYCGVYIESNDDRSHIPAGISLSEADRFELNHISLKMISVSHVPIHGIVVGSYTQLELRNSIISNVNKEDVPVCTGVKLALNSGSNNVHAEYCCFHNVTLPLEDENLIVDDNCIFEDPLWIDGNYHLREEYPPSPCIDAGDPDEEDSAGSPTDMGLHVGYTTDVEDIDGGFNIVIPSQFELTEAYPNPFNSTTMFSVTLPAPGAVNVIVYDVLGQQVDALMQRSLLEGNHPVVWSAHDTPSGVYFIHAQYGRSTITRRVVLIR